MTACVPGEVVSWSAAARGTVAQIAKTGTAAQGRRDEVFRRKAMDSGSTVIDVT